MTNDLINGLFEFGGSGAIWFNVWRLYRDKVVGGVHALPTSFFCLWSIWNIWFYYDLVLWWSWAGGVSMCVALSVWIWQLGHYPHVHES